MKELLEILKSNTPTIIPSDIGYELVCNASNNQAVELVKENFTPNSLTSYAIVVANLDQLMKYIQELPEVATELIELSTSPLNVILPNAVGISTILLSDGGKVPFRIINEGLIHDLALKINRPLLAIPAKNKGEAAPIVPEEIDKNLLKYYDKNLFESKKFNFTGKQPAIVELGIKGEIKIIRN